MMEISFTLSKNHISIGQIHWIVSGADDLNGVKQGRIDGDLVAVRELHTLAQQAIQQQWKDIFPPMTDLNPITEPFIYPSEMLSMLILAGYDVPVELQSIYDGLRGVNFTDVDF